MLGCMLLLLVTGTGVEGYGRRMFSVFVFQQLTLMMVVPPLLILGSPGTLLLRATPHGSIGGTVLRIALGALRSRAAKAVLHPAAVTPLLILSLFGLYLTGLADVLLGSRLGHVSMEVGFLVIGLMLNIPLVSTDPLPRKTSYVTRIFDTAIEMQLHAVFGLIVMFSGTILVPFFASPPKTWGVDPLRDQGLAGALVWSYGELPVAVILVVTLVRWSRQDGARAAKASKQAEVNGDPELEEYNAYLHSLYERQPSSRRT